MSKEDWIGKPFTQSIVRCARCGGDHEDLAVRPFTRPNVVGETGITYTHFAMCPTTDEPILVRFA